MKSIISSYEKLENILQIKLLTIGILMTFLFILIVMIIIRNESNAINNIAANELRLQELEGSIIDFDEIISMSVRMAAVTGDIKWEERYKLYKTPLESAIQEFIILSSDLRNNKAISEIANIKKEMEQIENQVFRLIHNGRLKDAEELTLSPKYEDLRQIYTNKVQNEMINNIQNRTAQQRITLGNHFSLLFPFSLITLVILLMGWGAITITLRKQIEAYKKIDIELRKSRDELEKRVEERTVELQKANTTLKNEISERKKVQDELARQAQELENLNKKLINKNNELDEFAHMVSNDLKEPLRQINRAGNIIIKSLKEETFEKSREQINSIMDNSRRMQIFIQDLLTLCKAGNSGLKYDVFSLEECVDCAMAALSVKIAETDARIEYDGLPEIMGDRTLLTHLYQNLIENAINNVREGKPFIKLTSEKTIEGLILGIKNNGNFNSEPDYAEKEFASGIVSKAIERHRGKIWVEALQEGIHIKFTLG